MGPTCGCSSAPGKLQKAYGTISQDDLINNAQSGDLLLFNTKNNFAASVQRTFLSTDFDHVAIIVKQEDDDSDVFLLEAVSSGVRMVRWRDIAAITGEGPDKWFSRVCYRRVNCTRDEFTQNRFVEFCK